MGYDLHITRKEEWSDDDGAVISLDEWLAVVDADPDLRHDGFAETRTPDGNVLRIEQPGLVVWTAHPDARQEGDLAWLSYSGGAVVVKNPDPAFIRKMIEIADRLDAHVEGDEGERYDDTSIPEDTANGSGPPRKKRWFGRS